MNLQTSRGRKTFHAKVTFKSFNASVCLDVSGKGAFHSEGPEALQTFEWLFMCVNTNVPHQVTGLLKLLCAVCTHMPSDSAFLSD